MGKRKIRLPGMIFAVLGAIFLIKAAVFLGEDHFARGKMLLAGTWEGVEKQAIRTFLPQVFYDPEAARKNFWDQARTFVERSLDYWNYLRAGEDVAYLEDTSTWEAIEEATHKSIADRLRESDGEGDSGSAGGGNGPGEQDGSGQTGVESGGQGGSAGGGNGPGEDNGSTETGENSGEMTGNPQPDGKSQEPVEEAFTLPAQQVQLSMEKLQNFDYLLNNFFVLDPSTTISQEELNIDSLMEKDLTLKQDNSAPQILIYHSHSQEGFADSKEGDPSTSVLAVGDYLEQILVEQYGYQVIHLKDTFDIVDGQIDRSAAYDYALEKVEQVLEENPSIEVVIDLHRDGVPDDVHLATEINGKPTAQIMFFNGLSKSKTNGPIDYLYNPYISDNLAFSFRLEYEAAQYYPDLTRCVYLKCYRYNLHVRPKSLLLEVGAQTNTFEEAKNAMEPFAVILNKVLKGE